MMRSGKNRNREYVMLGIVVAAVAVWQFVFIYFYPDSDTDAYAHFIIARDLVRNPYNFSLHWVWLPMFHYIDALFVSTGFGMQAVRIMNVAVWAAVPVLVYVYLSRKSAERMIPLTAGIITAVFPLGILMGSTAQPEPLFTLLILLFVFLFEEKKYILSSVILSFACLMRYEAWAVLAFTFIYIVISFYKARADKSMHNELMVSLNILLPLLFISVWVVLRYLSDGHWFAFLHGTVKFANDALDGSSAERGGLFNTLYDIIFYPVYVPFLFTGILVLLIPFGFRKFFSENRFLGYCGAGILLFITASWVTKSNLGLNRHFTSLIPVYSIMIAYGINEVIRKSQSFIERRRMGQAGGFIVSVKTVSAVVSLIMAFYIIMWLYIWQKDNNKYFDGRFRASSFISTLQNNTIILNNDPMIEVFSRLDYRRFEHYWMTDSAETITYINGRLPELNELIVVKNSVNPFFSQGNGELLFETTKDEKSGEKIRVYRFKKH
ncbi:MAG: hypothetical protein AB2L26_06205 [Ignavibacteria bacterium]